jgi:hypothetical protein
MNRAWLYGHRRVLILLAAGALAVFSIATAVAGQAASPDKGAPAFNTEGDADESPEPGEVDEPEDADSDDGTVEVEDVDEPEDADSEDGDEDDAEEDEDADEPDEDADEPDDADADDGDEDDTEEEDDD